VKSLKIALKLGKINMDAWGLLGSVLNINGLRPFHFSLFEDYAMISKGGSYIKNQMPGFALIIFRSLRIML